MGLLETGETFEVHNPAAPDETVASYQQSSAADAAEAVEAAADAQDEWATTPGPERGRILRKAGTILADRKDELTAMLVEEEGKARPEAAGEVQRAIDIFHYFAGKASDLGGTMKGSSSRDTTLYTREEPVGVAALITPWNYPSPSRCGSSPPRSRRATPWSSSPRALRRASCSLSRRP